MFGSVVPRTANSPPWNLEVLHVVSAAVLRGDLAALRRGDGGGQRFASSEKNKIAAAGLLLQFRGDAGSTGNPHQHVQQPLPACVCT